MTIVPLFSVYSGDGSERCLICGWRGTPSFYVGRGGRMTDDGLPERFPVCSPIHGVRWIERLNPRIQPRLPEE